MADLKVRPLHEKLARYMDLKAFDAVKVGKEQAERLKSRREINTKRARAAVRFFLIPENLARLNAQASAMSAREGQDPQGLEAQPASAVPQADAHTQSESHS